MEQANAEQKPARQRKGNPKDRASSGTVSPDTASPLAFPPYAATTPSPDSLITTFSHCSKEDIAQKRTLLKQFAEQALTSYITADPCADHHLKLLQLNTINGFTRNATVLGFNFDWLICESISPFGHDGQGPKPGTAPAAYLPSSLMPTSMQLGMRHHPWLDLFPLPRMRDNLLIAISYMGAEDEQKLFDDVMESGGGKNEWAGLVVWGEPWDPQSWELSIPFLQRWGWLIRGCPEIIVSTNHWRSQRGEKPIASPSCVQEL